MKDQEQQRQDLSQPSLEKLLENIPSKYKLVIEATIRAKKIKKLADEGHHRLDKWQKPLTEALNDIADGKVDQEVVRDYDRRTLDSFLDDEGVVSTFGSDEHEGFEEEGIDTAELGSKVFGDIDEEEDIEEEDLSELDEFGKIRLIPKWGESDNDIMEDADDDVIAPELGSNLGIDILTPERDEITPDDILASIVVDDESPDDLDALLTTDDDVDDIDLDLEALGIDDDDIDITDEDE